MDNTEVKKGAQAVAETMVDLANELMNLVNEGATPEQVSDLAQDIRLYAEQLVFDAEKEQQPAELTDKIWRRWYEKDLPRRGGVSTVPIPWTWRRYVQWCSDNGVRADSDQFLSTLRDLAQSGRIELVPHSLTHQLPPDEVKLCLRGECGETLYYWKWK
jgi:hypothetical protein